MAVTLEPAKRLMPAATPLKLAPIESVPGVVMPRLTYSSVCDPQLMPIAVRLFSPKSGLFVQPIIT